MFGRKPKPPQKFWRIGYALSTKHLLDRQKIEFYDKQVMEVYVYNKYWDKRYPSTTKAHRVVVGTCDPTDTDRISELMAKAAETAGSLEDALTYAEHARNAVDC